MVDFNWSTISELRLSEETTANASRNAMTDIEDNNSFICETLNFSHMIVTSSARAINQEAQLYAQDRKGDQNLQLF